MYRKQFEKTFDFLSLNSRIVKDVCSANKILAFDPSYIQKYGKKTPGLHHFWSGCSQSTKWGLEFCGIACVDTENRTAFHLEAAQTIINDTENLTEQYSQMLISRKDQLLLISNTISVDAWFYKKAFCDTLIKEGFDIIVRAKRNSCFKYYYLGPKTGAPGRPKIYESKVDVKDLDTEHFTLIDDLETETTSSYEAIVYSTALKRKVKLVVMKSKSSKPSPILYVSTDPTIEGKDVQNNYRLRFQIEFLFRDAKQHTGLNHCQARSENKLHFHVNMSLTSINVAKAVHHMNGKKYKDGPFSMSDIKQLNYNKMVLDLFISRLGINTKQLKNIKIIRKLIDYGCKYA